MPASRQFSGRPAGFGASVPTPSAASASGSTAAWNRSLTSREVNSSKGKYFLLPSLSIHSFEGKLTQRRPSFSNSIAPMILRPEGISRSNAPTSVPLRMWRGFEVLNDILASSGGGRLEPREQIEYLNAVPARTAPLRNPLPRLSRPGGGFF